MTKKTAGRRNKGVPAREMPRSTERAAARAARTRAIERLRTMQGLDLDKPAVMKRAWR
jgi:hypothetical protein